MVSIADFDSARLGSSPNSTTKFVKGVKYI